MKRSPLTLDEVKDARAGLHDAVSLTPVLECTWLSELIGRETVLKAENLQKTGSFKVRGATVKVSGLIGAGRKIEGVVAGSAGNHGQAVAWAARKHGLACTVYMPVDAAIAKVEAIQALGGTVIREGSTVDDCVAAARAAADHGNLEFIHPFDDREVLTGQASMGLELLDQIPDLGTVVIPVGGGGLAGATAWTIKQIRPAVRVIGVQVESCAPYLGAKPSRPVYLADGIAIKHPGELTRPLIEANVDQICAVSEDDIAAAMVHLMQRSRLVAEGAGAVGVAALLTGVAQPATQGRTAVILSGGNVDMGVLAAVTRQHESIAGRRLHVITRISDSPGSLASLLAIVAEAQANVVVAEHQREAIDLHVGETGVELILATRGPGHSTEVIKAIESHGYPLLKPLPSEGHGPPGSGPQE